MNSWSAYLVANRLRHTEFRRSVQLLADFSNRQPVTEIQSILEGGNVESFRSTITLANPIKQELQPIDVTALVDTGALHLCIPEHVALQLNLKEIEQREVVLADGKRQRVP